MKKSLIYNLLYLLSFNIQRFLYKYILEESIYLKKSKNLHKLVIFGYDLHAPYMQLILKFKKYLNVKFHEVETLAKCTKLKFYQILHLSN